jgi:hypothetical protein
MAKTLDFYLEALHSKDIDADEIKGKMKAGKKEDWLEEDGEDEDSEDSSEMNKDSEKQEAIEEILEKHLGNKFIHKGEGAKSAEKLHISKIAKEICDKLCEY